jgi:hypothetical protein
VAVDATQRVRVPAMALIDFSIKSVMVIAAVMEMYLTLHQLVRFQDESVPMTCRVFSTMMMFVAYSQ